MGDHVETIVCSSETDQIMLHVGTNDLVTDKILMEICNDIISLAAFIEVNGSKLRYFSLHLAMVVSMREQKLSMHL